MAFPPAAGDFMFHHLHREEYHHHHPPPHHQHHHLHDHQDHHLPSTSLNNISSSPFPGTHDNYALYTMMMRRSMSFSGIDDHGHRVPHIDEGRPAGDADDLSDDGSTQLIMLGERKKRLSLEQVKVLEKSFEEVGNKLDPERKAQLARGLGLQPRQVAIWFQNRRARWKTKQLERDYEVLKKQFDALKADNESLQAQNDKLHGELLALKRMSTDASNRETNHGSWTRNNITRENISEINFDLSRMTSSMIHSKDQPELHPMVQEGSLICNTFNGVDNHYPNFWLSGGAASSGQEQQFD